MLPKYQDIVELIKKGATVEAQEKIMELRETALELQEENVNLKSQVNELQQALKLKEQLRWSGSVYWLEAEAGKKEGPYCPRCYDVDGKLVRLQNWDTDWNCFQCKNLFPK